MSSFNPSYISRTTRERVELQKTPCSLSPWQAFSYIFEVCQQHLLINSGKGLGYAFSHTYSTDPTKSDIALEINYDWKGRHPQKYPAVFVFREDADYGTSKTLGQTVGMNVAESEENRLALVNLPIKIVVLAQGVGFAEEFADYMKYPFLYFAKEIEEEYCFHKVRLVRFGKPKPYTNAAEDTYSIELDLDTEFFNQWVIKGDHLKLKTFTMEVATSPYEPHLKNQ
jgi:hypothetical protein